MAVVALKSQAIGLIPAFNLGGGGGIIPLRAGIEGAAQSWKKGAVLIASAGQIIVAGVAPIAAIVGVAAGPATGVTNSEVLFYPASLGMIFEATFEDQNLEDQVLATANLLIAYAVHLDSNGIFYVNKNDIVNTCVVLTGGRDLLGTTRARVFVQFEDVKTVYK